MWLTYNKEVKMKIRFLVISLVLGIFFLTSCKSDEKVYHSNITPIENLDNNFSSENVSETSSDDVIESTSENVSDTSSEDVIEISENVSKTSSEDVIESSSENISDTNSQLTPTTKEPSIKDVKSRIYFLNMAELEYYYIDKILPVEDNALITALTKELQSTSYNKDFLSLTDKITVKSAKIDETTGVLKVVFSDSYIDYMNLGTNTEDGLLTCLLATYGYNLGVDKVAIYFNDELYTSLKGDLPEGYFNVHYPLAKVYNP